MTDEHEVRHDHQPSESVPAADQASHQAADDAAANEAAGDGPAMSDDAARTEAEYQERNEASRLREQLRTAQTEHEAALTTLRAQSRDRLMRAELRSEAVRAGIIDLDGLRLADTSAITFGDDGTVEGTENVISHLKTTKPYLFSNSRDSGNYGATTSPVARAPQPATPDLIDARHLTREQWQAERARLLSRRS